MHFGNLLRFIFKTDFQCGKTVLDLELSLEFPGIDHVLFFLEAIRFKAMPLYSSMTMRRDMIENYAIQQEARNSHIAGLNKRTNENNVIYSNNMEERKELIRRYLSFMKIATKNELRSYNNIMEKS